MAVHHQIAQRHHSRTHHHRDGEHLRGEPAHVPLRADRRARTSVRSNRSANVRWRESHSGHSHPMNRAAVSSRWARSRSSSRAKPTGAPSPCRTTLMPNSARPRLHPVTAGSSHRLASDQQDDDGGHRRCTPTTASHAAVRSATSGTSVAITRDAEQHVQRTGRRRGRATTPAAASGDGPSAVAFAVASRTAVTT